MAAKSYVRKITLREYMEMTHRREVSPAASLLAVGEALTAIRCAKANADVRLSFFPLPCRDGLRIVAVESVHRLGIAA
jgi:hypothetical protein